MSHLGLNVTVKTLVSNANVADEALRLTSRRENTADEFTASKNDGKKHWLARTTSSLHNKANEGGQIETGIVLEVLTAKETLQATICNMYEIYRLEEKKINKSHITAGITAKSCKTIFRDCVGYVCCHIAGHKLKRNSGSLRNQNAEGSNTGNNNECAINKKPDIILHNAGTRSTRGYIRGNNHVVAGDGHELRSTSFTSVR